MLNVNRSTVYHKKQPIKSTDLELIRLIDELYMKKPISGSRTIRNDLRRPGHKVNRKRVQRLTRLMGIEAIYPKPKTSRLHPQHKVYPYFLRNPDINRPNQVWAADITYIPMSRESMYLVPIMDWHSRKVLSWRLSNTLDTDSCTDALEMALERFDKPEVFNTGQGTQFTSRAFTDQLKVSNVRISMDGRGRVPDNILIEHLWWTPKYQYLHLRTSDNGIQLLEGLGHWFRMYNSKQSH